MKWWIEFLKYNNMSIKEIATKIEDLEEFKECLRKQYQSTVGASYTITITGQIPTRTVEMTCASTMHEIESCIESQIKVLKGILKHRL
jgi:hypothetical protein